MGLIRAGAGAVGSVFGDQWKEYFYCDALEQDVLVRKGVLKGRVKSRVIKEVTISFQMVV